MDFKFSMSEINWRSQSTFVPVQTNTLTMMHSCVPSRNPLILFLIKPIEISRQLIQKHKLWIQILLVRSFLYRLNIILPQVHHNRYEIINRLQKSPSLIPIHNLNLLKTGRAVVHKHLKPTPDAEHGLIGPLCHREQDSAGPHSGKPGKMDGVASIDDHVDNIEGLEMREVVVAEVGVIDVVWNWG